MSKSPKALAKAIVIALDPGWKPPGQQQYDNRIVLTRKRSIAKMWLKRDGITKPSDVARRTGIMSISTRIQYRNIFQQFFRHVREEYGVNKLSAMKPEYARTFLQKKIDDVESRRSFAKYASGMEKLTVGLGRIFQQDIDWREMIQETRDHAQQVLEKPNRSRGYERPEEAMALLENDDHVMMARLQLEHGARISEVAMLDERNIKGYARGQILLTQTKGGRERMINVPPDVYDHVRNAIEKDGAFKVNKPEYVQKMIEAFGATGQAWNGSHGLRHTYVQRRYAKLQGGGMEYEEALKAVSEEIGHSRPQITLWYLK